MKPDLGWVNRINIAVLLPALIFSALASKDFELAANLPLIAGSIGVVLGSGLLAWPFAKLLHQDHRTWVPPMMFNNCGNMGLPLAYLSFGQPGLSAMVTLFTISNLAHFTLGVHIVKRDAALWPILRSPMVVATFLGFAFALAHPPMPEWLTLAIKMVGDAADSADADLARRAARRGALGRLASRRDRRPRLPAHRHCDRGPAHAGARPRCRRSRACSSSSARCRPRS